MVAINIGMKITGTHPLPLFCLNWSLTKTLQREGRVGKQNKQNDTTCLSAASYNRHLCITQSCVHIVFFLLLIAVTYCCL